MTRRQQGLIALVAVAVAWGYAGAASAAPPSPAQVCEAAKLTAAGKKEQCLAAERAKEVKGKIPNYAKCSAAFTIAFTKAETKAGLGVCPSEGDAGAVEDLIDSCFSDLSAALAGTPNPPSVSQAFPATGQTTCWNSAGIVIVCAGTGQDGDVQAGATLSYTDNGDGTITDDNTGLMWEKKSDDGTIHDKDTTYTLANAYAVHVAGLNTVPCFAGHCDWRLPNVKELQSILSYGTLSPAVSPAFNVGCVAGCNGVNCSCTTAGNYWSSSSAAGGPANAWVVDFGIGFVLAGGKSSGSVVRAVRGGL